VFTLCFLCIYRDWLAREERKKKTVGQVWYLISMVWWTSWNTYVSSKVTCSFITIIYILTREFTFWILRMSLYNCLHSDWRSHTFKAILFPQTEAF